MNTSGFDLRGCALLGMALLALTVVGVTPGVFLFAVPFLLAVLMAVAVWALVAASVRVAHRLTGVAVAVDHAAEPELAIAVTARPTASEHTAVRHAEFLELLTDAEAEQVIRLGAWSAAVIALVVLAAMGQIGEYGEVVTLSVASLAIGGALVWKLADTMKPSWFTWAGEG